MSEQIEKCPVCSSEHVIAIERMRDQRADQREALCICLNCQTIWFRRSTVALEKKEGA